MLASQMLDRTGAGRHDQERDLRPELREADRAAERRDDAAEVEEGQAVSRSCWRVLGRPQHGRQPVHHAVTTLSRVKNIAPHRPIESRA